MAGGSSRGGRGHEVWCASARRALGCAVSVPRIDTRVDLFAVRGTRSAPPENGSSGMAAHAAAPPATNPDDPRTDAQRRPTPTRYGEARAAGLRVARIPRGPQHLEPGNGRVDRGYGWNGAPELAARVCSRLAPMAGSRGTEQALGTARSARLADESSRRGAPSRVGRPIRPSAKWRSIALPQHRETDGRGRR
jgi:hypothetical protein